MGQKGSEGKQIASGLKQMDQIFSHTIQCHLMYFGQQTVGWTPNFSSSGAGTGTNSNLEHQYTCIASGFYAPVCAVAVLEKLDSACSIQLRIELTPVVGGVSRERRLFGWTWYNWCWGGVFE